MSEVTIGLYRVCQAGGMAGGAMVLASKPIAQEVIAVSSSTAQVTTLAASAATLGSLSPGQVVWRVSVVGTDAVVLNFAAAPNPANAAAAKLLGPVMLGNSQPEVFSVEALGDKCAVINA